MYARTLGYPVPFSRTYCYHLDARYCGLALLPSMSEAISSNDQSLSAEPSDPAFTRCQAYFVSKKIYSLSPQ
jgi:hypothetical protein